MGYQGKRERVMSEITIKGITKEDTAWTKEITLEREGETYLATLYWSIADGYELVFKTNPTPKWVEEWEINYQDGGDPLEYTLDCLTDEVIEASYL
jgi:hypothetical protein